MTNSEILKKEILAQYKSIRQFALQMDIPYSTLVTAIDRGIEGMAYGTVIRICCELNLNPIDFTLLESDITVSEQLFKNPIMNNYIKLNLEGRKKIFELLEDFTQMKKYCIK